MPCKLIGSYEHFGEHTVSIFSPEQVISKLDIAYLTEQTNLMLRIDALINTGLSLQTHKI